MTAAPKLTDAQLRKALRAVDKANETGAAYTYAVQKGLHPLCVAAMADGLLSCERRGHSFYWTVTDAGYAALGFVSAVGSTRQGEGVMTRLSVAPKLTEPQRDFLETCARPDLPEGAKRVRRQQWRTAEALARRGLVSYSGGYYARITDAGRAALAASPPERTRSRCTVTEIKAESKEQVS